MQRMSGPFNLGVNQEVGILVEGFDTPPYVMMGHSPSYYGPALERCGLEPVQDMLAYELNSETLRVPSVMQALIDRSAGRAGVRPLRRENYAPELETMRDIVNEAWRHNCNFLSFTREVFTAAGK